MEIQLVGTPSIRIRQTAPGLNTLIRKLLKLVVKHLFFGNRRSRSITSGAAVRDLCTAPSAWREAAWQCHSSPVRSVSDR